MQQQKILLFQNTPPLFCCSHNQEVLDFTEHCANWNGFKTKVNVARTQSISSYCLVQKKDSSWGHACVTAEVQSQLYQPYSMHKHFSLKPHIPFNKHLGPLDSLFVSRSHFLNCNVGAEKMSPQSNHPSLKRWPWTPHLLQGAAILSAR